MNAYHLKCNQKLIGRVLTSCAVTFMSVEYFLGINVTVELGSNY